MKRLTSIAVMDCLADFQRSLEIIAPPADAEFAQWLDSLIHFCHESYSKLSQSEWLEYVATCRVHPIFHALREDPFLERAFDKPRNYPGDAVLLDMIYDQEEGIPVQRRNTLTARGRGLFRAYQDRDSCRAVRERRNFVAQILKRLPPASRILSVACGHLRELDFLADHDLEIVAFDQDQQSLDEVSKRVAQLGLPKVTTLQGKIADLVRGRIRFSHPFDVIYSTGLYDYLEEPNAIALTSALAGNLSRGGRLYIGNFAERVEMPFCEVFQDWKLIPRDRNQLETIGRVAIPDAASVTATMDEWEAIIWLQLCAT